MVFVEFVWAVVCLFCDILFGDIVEIIVCCLWFLRRAVVRLLEHLF